MRVCDLCGGQFAEGEPSCPSCRSTVGALLSRPLSGGGHQNMNQVALETLRALEGRWALNPFAAGWRLLDVLGRLVLVVVLVWLAFHVHRTVGHARESTLERLATHERQVESAAKSSSQELRDLSVDYSSLVESSRELIGALDWNGQLLVLVVLGIMALLVTSAVTSYHQFKFLNRVKATLAYMCTERGHAFLGRFQDELSAKAIVSQREDERLRTQRMVKDAFDSGVYPIEDLVPGAVEETLPEEQSTGAEDGDEGTPPE